MEIKLYHSEPQTDDPGKEENSVRHFFLLLHCFTLKVLT